MSLALVTPSEQPANPLPTIFLILAVCGAVADWRYRRRGGVKSTKRDRVLFVVAISLCAALMIVLSLMGANSAGLVAVIQIAIVLFMLWELDRWRIRRANPLPPRRDPSDKQPS